MTLAENRNGNKAPVAVFAFNRPYHLARTLRSLVDCKGFEGRAVHVFCDGPRLGDPLHQVEAAREVAHTILGSRAIYHEATHNKGLARSIIDGVDALTREYGRVVVVEDDLELAPGFLEFMDNALSHYEAVDEIMQVSGHAFDVPEFRYRSEAVLLPLTTTWGWGTWRRAWCRFDETAGAARCVLDTPDQRKAFNLGGIYDYATMLEDQLAGHRDSWGIRFYLSAFEYGGLGVFPPSSLVRNTGFDGSGSHGRGWLRSYHLKPRPTTWPEVSAWSFPAAARSAQDFAAVKRAISRQNGGRIGQIVDVVKRIIR
jgi:hypothetical protein